MRSIIFRIFAAVLCLALLCGCGANNGGTNNSGTDNTPPTADNTQQENASGNTAPDENSGEQEEPAALMTDDELAGWESYFNTVENNGLLRFPYSDPESDPDQLAPYLSTLFYDIGSTGAEISDEERSMLTEAGVIMETDVFRLTREFINAYLLEKFNVPSNKTENLIDAGALGTYLLWFDAWYDVHGDCAYRAYELNRGEIYENGAVKLYYFNNFLSLMQENGEMDYVNKQMVVTLIPREDGTWYIASHEINEEN